MSFLFTCCGHECMRRHITIMGMIYFTIHFIRLRQRRFKFAFPDILDSRLIVSAPPLTSESHARGEIGSGKKLIRKYLHERRCRETCSRDTILTMLASSQSCSTINHDFFFEYFFIPDPSTVTALSKWSNGCITIFFIRSAQVSSITQTE